jgi:hypothetical protein
LITAGDTRAGNHARGKPWHRPGPAFLDSELVGRFAADFALHVEALPSNIWFKLPIKAYISVTS